VDVRVCGWTCGWGSGRRAEGGGAGGRGSVREVVLTCRRAWGRQCKQREGVREMARACVRRACGGGTRGRACVATL